MAAGATGAEGGLMTKKKRNPNDATFRNISALKKRVARLEHKLEALLSYYDNGEFVGDFVWKPKKKTRP